MVRPKTATNSPAPEVTRRSFHPFLFMSERHSTSLCHSCGVARNTLTSATLSQFAGYGFGIRLFVASWWQLCAAGIIRNTGNGSQGVGGGAVSRVLFRRGSDARTVIYLGWRSPDISCGLPAAQVARVRPRRLFGLAPTGGYRAAPVARARGGLLPHLFTLARRRRTGGMFSVALSVALRRPGVTWQPTLWSSDFPRPWNHWAATVAPHHRPKNIASSIPSVKTCCVIAEEP